MILFPATTLAAGDLFGFAAVVLAGVASLLMVLRGKILKVTKNLPAIRSFHIILSALAGIFIVLHVAYYITFPINTGILLGYGTFGMALAVWITGTAFLERVRDSFLFHSSLSIAMVALALIHAAATSANFPLLLAEITIGASVFILLANFVYQMLKLKKGKVGTAPPAATAKKVVVPQVPKRS